MCCCIQAFLFVCFGAIDISTISLIYPKYIPKIPSKSSPSNHHHQYKDFIWERAANDNVNTPDQLKQKNYGAAAAAADDDDDDEDDDVGADADAGAFDDDGDDYSV